MEQRANKRTKLWTVAWTSLIPALLWGSVAFGQNYPDFTGTWTLDRDRSDIIDPILEVFGIGHFKRSVAPTLPFVVKIRMEDNALEVDVQSSIFYKRHDRVPLDARVGQSSDFDGNPTYLFSRWEDNGQTLITDFEMTARDGGLCLVTIRRYLLDSTEEMMKVITLRRPDGSTATMKRVFVREPGTGEVSATARR